MLVFFLSLLSMSCNKQEEMQYEKDIQLIKDHLNQNGITATEDEKAHFFYNFYLTNSLDNKPSKGENLKVILNYNCYSLDGNIILNQQIDTIPLDNAIYGWQLALPLMNTGEKMKLWLPSRLAYGQQGTNKIAPNTILVFDIELQEIHSQL